MLVLITYDVNVTELGGQRRLRHIAKICTNYGQRVQNSVFECLIDPAQWVECKNKLEKTIDPKIDSLRYYFLGKNWHNRVEHFGKKTSFDPEEPLII